MNSQSNGRNEMVKKHFPWITTGLCLMSFHSLLGQTTRTVGTTGADYTTLKAAFDAINAGTLTGTIQLNVTDNTTETTAAVLNASGSVSANYISINIKPSGSAARTISGSLVGLPLVDFNGADNVTIDGLNSGGNSLTIVNQSTSATAATSTIRFRNDATSNTVTNCFINGASTTTGNATGGNIFFSTGASVGNDNNMISNCSIGPDGTNLPSRLISSSGSTSPTTAYNSSNTISGSKLYDFFNPIGDCRAIDLWSGTSDWTISNNRFYQTAARTWTTGAEMRAINISSAAANGNNFQISGNTIGFADENGTGVFTISGGANIFKPMYVNVGTTAPTSIQGNTIAGIDQTTTSGGSTDGPFAPSLIYVASGIVNIGTVTGNTIGSPSSSGSISFTSTSSSINGFHVVYYNGGGNVSVSNNNIGGMTVGNAGSGAVVLRGIRISTNGTATVMTNTIGSVAAPLLNNASGTASQVAGIHVALATSTGTAIVSGNLLSNFSLSAGNAGSLNAASVIGITVTNAVGTIGSTISQNTIHSLSNTNLSAAAKATGIYFSASGAETGANSIACNFIHSLSLASSNASAQMNGIEVTGGVVSLQNNMIRLGIDATGNSIANGIQINGLSEPSGSASFLFSYYYNSVYVGGDGVSGTGNSHAFRAATQNTRNLVNNIFMNARSNGGGTGKHYAVNLGFTSSTAGVVYNYNLYQAAGTGGVFGRFNNADVATLAAWCTATGQEVQSLSGDPGFVNPTGTSSTANLHIDPSNANGWNVNGKGIAGSSSGSMSVDVDGETRSTTLGLPADIGADEFSPTIDPPSITVTSPTLGSTSVFVQAGRSIGEIVWGNSGTLPTSVSLKYFSGDRPPVSTGGQTINSYWTIANDNTDGSGFSYNAKLYYSLAEIDTIPSGFLQLAKRQSTTPWVAIASTPVLGFPSYVITTSPLTSFSHFTLTNTGSPLPVQLTSFNGTRIGSASVRLNWRTVSEVNNYGFIAQRRINGLMDNWIDVANSFVAGYGTTNEPHDYSFTDNTASPGSIEYRLKQIDLDGTEHFTEPIVVSGATSVKEEAPKGFALMQNYPNPFNPTTHFGFRIADFGLVTLRVFDLLGREVATLVNVRKEPGEYSIAFDARGLASGIYFYKLIAGSFVATKKMLLTR
jgi:hypothetical protein